MIMKTITRKNVNKITRDFTLENLSTCNIYIEGKGFSKVKIDPDFLEESSHEIANLLGGIGRTKSRVAFNIRNTPIHHWASGRIMFENGRWVYCAGQDYTAEIAAIRKALS